MMNEATLWCETCQGQKPFDYDFHGIARCQACGQEVNDNVLDDSAACNHDDGAVFWNPYNKATQCHKCGQIFPPMADQPELRANMERMGEAVI